jgi:hypothetical protein
MTYGFVGSLVNSFLDTNYGTLWLKLHTGDPSAAGTSNVAAGDTTRKQATMASASGGSKAMTGSAGPWTNGGTSETIAALSGWTASTAGSVTMTTALSASQAWVATNTFTLTALTISFTPIAV